LQKSDNIGEYFNIKSLLYPKENQETVLEIIINRENKFNITIPINNNIIPCIFFAPTNIELLEELEYDYHKIKYKIYQVFFLHGNYNLLNYLYISIGMCGPLLNSNN
jgi:hypothetical protein